jgi:hypothetical protein
MIAAFSLLDGQGKIFRKDFFVINIKTTPAEIKRIDLSSWICGALDIDVCAMSIKVLKAFSLWARQRGRSIHDMFLSVDNLWTD